MCSSDLGLLCDNLPDGSVGSGSAAGPGETQNTDSVGGADNINDPSNVGGAQIKQEDVKPNVSNCSTPLQQQNASSVLPSETDLFDGFDSKDGGKKASHGNISFDE